MITITALKGKYYFTDFVGLNSEEIAVIDETSLETYQLKSIKDAEFTNRITLSIEDLEKIELILQQDSLGVDLTPYALKSSVENLDLIKENKEEGKKLSTNDFSNKYKQQLDTLDSVLVSKINSAIDKLVDGAPDTFDTLKEIAGWIETKGITATKLAEELSGKADKVEGKGLSTNDFTNEDKAKLSSLVQFKFIKLTQAEYDLLSEEEKASDTILYLVVG